MATKKKALLAAAGGGTVEPGEYIDDLFSTYLYTGNETSRSIQNGIDLSTDGGMVWIKRRDGGNAHFLFDTQIGTGNFNQIDAGSEGSGHLTSFNTDGFSLNTGTTLNGSPNKMASWTFKQEPGFFDIVTYTGNGTNGRNISHNLGCDVGAILVTARDSSPSGGWYVYHKSQGANYYSLLNSNAAKEGDASAWWNTAPTDTQFTVASTYTNNDGVNYVAYLFADGDDAAAQIFGTTGVESVIKCGITADSSTPIDLGWEPQWLMYKNISNGYWYVIDDTRRWMTDGTAWIFHPNTTDSEAGDSQPKLLSTGFVNNASRMNTGTIYIAIRRSHKPAESATEVFTPDIVSNPGVGNIVDYDSGFPVDALLHKHRTLSSDGFYAHQRLLGGDRFKLWLTGTAEGSTVYWDDMDSFRVSPPGSVDSTTNIGYSFKRSEGFFDVVAYTGDGVAGRTVRHNLGVAPEMIICMKQNGAASTDKPVYHAGLGTSYSLTANTGNAQTTANYWNNTAPTDSEFTLGSLYGNNGSTYTYAAWLFASREGVSKVGTFSYSGSSVNVDCGFTNGARFVLVKIYDSTDSWLVFDTERGINASLNDPYLQLNATTTESNSVDLVDPYSAGFTVKSMFTNGNYIFLAIA